MLRQNVALVDLVGAVLSERVQELLVHGVCHLIGHDHVDDQDFERMQEEELKVLGCLRNTHWDA